MSRASRSCRRSPRPNSTRCWKRRAASASACSRSAIPNSDAAPQLEVVSRIGVGYDAVDVPALTRAQGAADDRRHGELGQRRRGRRVPDDVAWPASGAAMDTMVKEGRWHDRYEDMPVDLYGKTVADRRLRQDRHALGAALRGDGDQRAGLRPVHVFRDDPRQRLRAGRRTSTRRWRAPISSRSTARRRRRPPACSTPPGIAADEAHRLPGEHRRAAASSTRRRSMTR